MDPVSDIGSIGDKDEVSARLSGETLVAKPRIEASNDTNTVRKGALAFDSFLKDQRRFLFSVVTAEVARAHARQHPQDNTEPTNGVLAFNGESVGENVTLVRPQIDSQSIHTLILSI